MNQLCYRIIFNKTRGLLMAVAETARACGGKRALGSRLGVAISSLPVARLSWIGLAVLLATGALVTTMPRAYAQIVADPSAPHTQQPVVVNTANGIPQVNIQTPSAAGVSRNTYSQFDVNRAGAILNNSRSDVQTQLGGWIQRNPNLANGSARVIVNEVNSSNPSMLRGFVEVAGDRAQVIIANPSGVTCDGCGFINASRSTLTTGTPIINNGSLDGYLVRGGRVSIEGNGLNDSQSDFTDIIARAVKVNAGIWSKELKLTTGTNRVNADNSSAEGISSAEAQPLLGIDVAQLGGMYANKIVLVGTEAGVGVRNAGTIGAAAGELTLTAAGHIENSGSMAARDQLHIRAEGQGAGVHNTGSISSSSSSVSLQADADIDNSDAIAAQTEVKLASASLRNGGAISAATGDLLVDTVGVVANSGQLEAAGDLAITAHQAAGNLVPDLNNSGTIAAGGNVSLATDGDLRNDGSISAQDVSTSAQSVVNNGSIGARGGAALNLQRGFQQGTSGRLAAVGDINLTMSGDYENAGDLQANALTLSAANIDNRTNASLQATDITLSAANRLSNAGEISASKKLNITATSFTNSGAALGDDVVIQTRTLENTGANALIGAGNSMALWVSDTLSNRGKAIIYSGGDMEIAANGARDANGLVNAVNEIINEDSVVEAGGNMDIAAAKITNSRSNVSVDRVTTVDEQRTLTIPSWWHAGPNPAHYDPNSSNYVAHEFYYVNPADVLENTYLVTPDGNVVGRAVIRTHATDTILMRDTGGGWGAYGTIRRITATDGTRVLYYTTQASGISNPDQVSGGDDLRNTGTNVQWSMLPTYSNQYGSCTTDCIRFMAEPGYTDPNSIMLRDTQKALAPELSAYERVRYAHHVAVEDQLAADAGVAAEIRAGGNANIHIGQTLQNQFSNIVVNGALNLGGAGADITNSGQTLYRRHYFDGTFVTTGGVTVGYSNPSISEVIGTTQGAIIGKQGLTITARNFSNADIAAGSAANIRSDVILTTGSGQSVGSVLNDASTRPGATAPDAPIPVRPNPMFVPATSGNYLLETRTQFTDRRTWLSSDYLLTALNVDPSTTQKRLGDGFYEQRMVREQMAQLTGRPSGIANDDSQYQKLLTNAVSVAQSWNLRPGVALTSEQISHLTSDIVWLETQKVLLPDGRTEEVLVPKLYLAHVDKDALKNNGALVSGDNITIQAENISNKGGFIDGRASGTGRTVLVASNDIANLGGGISGDEIVISAGGNVRNETLTTTETYNNGQTSGSYTSLSNQGSITADKNLTITAGEDITNLGATLASGRSGDATAGKLSMSAGRDINLGTVKTGSTYDANFSGYFGHAQSVSSVGSTVNAGADLTMVAQRDLSLTAAQVDIGTNGSGSGSLMAGRAVTIGAALDKADSTISHTASKSYTRADNESVTVRGSNINAADGISIKAGLMENADVKVAASNITAGKALEVAASGDINVVSEESYQSHSEYAQSTSRGLLSSTTRTSYGKRAYTNAVGSTLSGDTTVLQAGKDMSIVGSNVVSSTGTSLVAGNNITVASANDKFESAEGSNKKSSGLLSGGGFGFTIGTRELDNKNTTVSTTAVSSNVGSIDGNVSITAGNTYTQSGSNVLAPKGDIDVVAKQISILAAAETERNTQDMVFKQSGLTVQITSPVLSAIQTAQQMARAAKNTSGGRMQLLAAANIGFAGKNAVDAVRTGQGFEVDGKDNPQVRTNALDENGKLKLGADGTPETRDATAADKAGGINLAISVGASKSENHSQSSASTARGSTLNAGGNISLAAQGGGADSNLIVQGSDIKSGANTLLKADNEVRMLAAQSTTEQHSSNKAISGSVGISIGTDGFLVNAGLSGSRGRGDGNDVAQVNTHVDAGNKLTITSGTDTTIKGAVASGKQVVIDVGTSGSGNLNIESLQDTSTYKSRQQSAGGSISVGMGRMGGSLNLARSSVDGNYASVNEQSGVKAGDDGFQIKVAGNTDLKGAKIASTDKAAADGKNSLTTQTLTQSDIQNRSDFKAESQSMGMGTSLAGSALGLAGSALGMGNASGSDSSATRSGISQADIKITDDAAQQAKTGNTAEQTIASINADVSSDRDTSGKITKTWNGQALQANVEAQAQITQAFGQQASKLIGDYAQEQQNKAVDLREQADAAIDPDVAKALNDQASAIESNWGPNGTMRVLAHSVVGGLTGGISGAAGVAAGTLTAPAVSDALQKAGIDGALAKALTGLSSTLAGTAIGGTAGGAAAYNEVVNNYLKHEEAQRLSQLRDKQQIGQCDSNCEAEVKSLEALDKERDLEFQACIGQESPGCVQILRDVRQAAAQYIRRDAPVSAMTFTYDEAEGKTLAMAQQTMNGYTVWNVGKGAVDAVADSIAMIGTVLATGYKALVQDPQAKADIQKALGAAWEFLKEPENWPQLLGAMSPAQRELLAQAYETGDGTVIAKMAGELLLNMPAGGVSGTVKNVTRTAEEIKTIEQLAKRVGTERVVEVPVGSKGNWEPLINTGKDGQLAPKTAYLLDNGHVYITDASGRVTKVEGNLSLNTMDRNPYQQLCAGKSGCAGDDGGHLIASSLGGAGDRINIVPQASTLNRGDWRAMEDSLRRELASGKSVSVSIDLAYPSAGGARPRAFSVSVTVDGVTQPPRIFNQ
ncbi:filamentous hemagglutinin outer membrane protein [Herbaspirillum sp. GW103]|uniref:hemagglutinin repeat-containing protein n=1 Tax=Herbaspirillum sp. GW103 TaxID=1175306 RepID=UPI00025E2EF2|nr:hemagglutinin repeat-containing protein [Herbaspirillum sp. GW103]EIJ45920.1 filamentous hemagglutinin outer membrane protein [Herbaspirillum sp. GW103]